MALGIGFVEQVDLAMRFLGSEGFSRVVGSFACYQSVFYKQIRYTDADPRHAIFSFGSASDDAGVEPMGWKVPGYHSRGAAAANVVPGNDFL